MKHRVNITPLNCGYSTGLNEILRMEQDEYTADVERSIYCKSPDISWFKMKSISLTPYLEPYFIGVRIGDVITIEYDALAESGSTVMLHKLLFIRTDYSTTEYANVNAPNAIASTHYKHYKIVTVIPPSFIGLGVLINIRPASTSNVVILKNIEISIDTSNQDFSMVNNIVEFRTKTDFMKCVDFLSGTNVKTAYNNLLTVFNAGELIFPDDFTMAFAGVDVSNFKGLMSCFNGYKYRPCVAIYCEYVTDGSNVVTASVNSVTEAGVVASVGNINFPATATVKKKIRYINGGTTACRKTFVDLGRLGANNFSLKNVRFSMPQFDDSVKRIPNQIDELYTNLRAKLR